VQDLLQNREFEILDDNKEPQLRQWRAVSSDFARITFSVKFMDRPTPIATDPNSSTVKKDPVRPTLVIRLTNSMEDKIQKLTRTADEVDDFGNLALVKNSDGSKDWQPCRIVSKTLKKDLKEDLKEKKTMIKKQGSKEPENKKKVEIQQDISYFNYEVEFRDSNNCNVRRMTLTSDEIIFSAKYLRETQSSYRAKTYQMIRKTYGIHSETYTKLSETVKALEKSPFEKSTFEKSVIAASDVKAITRQKSKSGLYTEKKSFVFHRMKSEKSSFHEADYDAKSEYDVKATQEK